MADRIFLGRSCSDQLLGGDRKVANANPRGVPHSIGDRPRRADNADLTDAFDAQRIDLRVRLLDQDGLERRHVGVNRHMVFGEVLVTLPLRHTCARARARAQLGEQVDRHARAAKRRIPAHDLAYQPILGRRLGSSGLAGQGAGDAPVLKNNQRKSNGREVDGHVVDPIGTTRTLGPL